MPNIVTNVKWTDNTRELQQNLTSGLSTIGRSVADVRQQVRETATSVAALEKALATIKPSGKALIDLTAELDKTKSAHAQLKQELAALDPKAKATAAALKQVGQDGSAAAKGVKDAGDAAKAAGDKAEKAGASFQQIGAALSTVGRGMTAAITVPIVGAAAAAIKFASDFEADMVKVHTLSGVTETDMQAMRTQILALGPAVGLGPDELAKALLAVTSTGLTGAKAMDVLTIAAKASAVGMGDAATIARTITSIIKAYGEESMSAAKASEIMFKIVKDGNAEAGELAGSLGRVVGIASTLGIAFEDVGTFIATFTRLGVNTAEAVTALRAFISNLELKKPSKDAIAVLDSVGLTFDKLRANIKDVGLTAAALDLFGRFKGHEADLQPVVANIRAMAGAMGTYGAQAKDAGEIQKHMVAQSHELADAFGRTTETSAFKWKALTAELEALAITIGVELLPTLNTLLDKTLIPGIKTVEGLVDAWKQLPAPIKQFSELILLLGAAGGPVLLALGAVARSIAAIQILLFGGNMAAGSSVAGWLTKIGAGGTAVGGAGGAAAAAGGATAVGVAEGAGLAALVARFQSGLTAGAPLTGAQSVAMGGSLWLAAKQANDAFDRVDKELLEQRGAAFAATLPRVTTHTDALFPGGKPPTIGATGMVAGTLIEDVQTEATAVGTLADKVKALTAAEREDILAKHALKESIAAIAKETGIAADVVGMVLRQHASGTAGTKQYAEAWRELNATGTTYRETLASLTADQVTTLEYYLQAGRSVALLAQAFPGLTKAQIEAVDASLKMRLASIPLTDAQSTLALTLLRVNAAADETIYSIEAIAKEAGAAPVQIRVLKAALDELAKAEKAVKLSGPIAGLTLVNPKQDITEYRAELAKLTKAQQENEDAHLAGIAAAVRAIERKRDADIAAVTAELGADNDLAKRRIQLATETAAAQIALATGTSTDIIAITHALGLATTQELQANVAKFKTEYDTLKASGTATWAAIDAARKKYEDALAASDAGDAFTQGLKHALAGIPDLLIQAFLGGGGLKGALSALGVQMGKVFADALTSSIKASLAGQSLGVDANGTPIEGPLPKGKGFTGTTIAAAAGTGALAGIGAEASGATGKQAAGTVAMTAASAGIAAGVLAGEIGTGLAVGAATLGVGLAVVAAIEIYKAKHMAQWEKLGKDIGRDFGVNLSKETLKEWEKQSKEIGRQATGLVHLDEIIAAKGGLKEFGVDKALAAAHDLFSMIDQGKLSIAQVRTEFDKLWPDLLKSGTDAYGRISDKLKELIRLNRVYGADSQLVADFLKGQGAAALDGFTAVVAAQDTQLTKYEALKKGVTDATAAVNGLHKANVDYLGLLGQMKPAEYAALAKAFGEAHAKGFKGDIVAFFKQQAELYTYAPESDPRLKTWLSSDTATAIAKQQAAASDAVTKVIDQMMGAEKTALQDGYAQALQDGFAGTLSDFLLQQNQLYGVAQEGDARLKTWLSDRTARELNGIPEVQQYNKALKDQQDAAAGAKQELSDLGIQAVATYAAAVASGTSPADALKAIGPSLTTLQKEYEALGLDIEDVALQARIMQNKITTANPTLIAGVAGLAKEFVALDNMGLATDETFAAMQRTGAAMFERLQTAAATAGGTSKDALIPMQQWLHEAEDAAKTYGFKLDDATQRMIDLSKETGVWKDTDPTKDKEQGMRDLIDAVHDLVDALRGIPPKVKTAVDVGVTWNVPPMPRRPDDDQYAAAGGIVRSWGIQHFADGGRVLPFIPRGRDIVPAMLAVDEVVLNTPQQQRLNTMLQAGATMATAVLATGTGGVGMGLPTRGGGFGIGTATQIHLGGITVVAPDTASLTDMEGFAPAFGEGLRANTGLMRTMIEQVAIKALEDRG